MERIYLDHAATTPVHQEVVEAMNPIFTDIFGNPSSIHAFGRKARQYLDDARRTMAAGINALEKEIIFTSGGTEADNLALIGTALANKDKGNHIITTVQEHHATLHAAKRLEELGFNVTYLSVNENGMVDTNELQAVLQDDTILVSVMYVNNETGMIQPIAEIGTILAEHQAYFHTDAVQAFGLLPIDVKKLGADMLTVSSHKINGPKGVGFLYASEKVKLDKLQFGGEQERKRRAGTENVAGIVGFAKAVELMLETNHQRSQTYADYKALFLETLTQAQVDYKVNGDKHDMIASIVNVSFPGTNVESLLTNFDLSGVAASSGSACTAGSVEPSHVLSAMFGKDDQRTINSIRFSFGTANTTENVQEAAKRIAKITKKLAAS